jgi:hypothetical protein
MLEDTEDPAVNQGRWLWSEVVRVDLSRCHKLQRKIKGGTDGLKGEIQRDFWLSIWMRRRLYLVSVVLLEI